MRIEVNITMPREYVEDWVRKNDPDGKRHRSDHLLCAIYELRKNVEALAYEHIQSVLHPPKKCLTCGTLCGELDFCSEECAWNPPDEEIE